MGIDIETPEEFLDDYKDPKYIETLMEQIMSRAYQKEITTLSEEAKESHIYKVAKKAEDFFFQECGENPYWDAEIEANCSLGAQYILMAMGMGFYDEERFRKIFQFIINNPGEDGLYPIYYGGPAHYSSNLLIYLAGRALGYEKDAPELKKVYEYLKSNDLFKSTNMETKFLLAVYGLISWDCVPVFSPLLILLPDDADFTIYSISYWVRTSLVPMCILYNKKFTFSKLPLKKEDILDLHPERKAFPPFVASNRMWEVFLEKLYKTYAGDRETIEKIARKKCEEWVLDHQDDSGDWGGIYPAMQYCLIGLYAMGHGIDSPPVKKGFEALIRFQSENEGAIHQQSCTSPVWDTGWTLLALDSLGHNLGEEQYQKYYKWLIDNQIFHKGDWSIVNKTGFGGAWAFQFYNVWYPDTDDSAVVIMSLLRNSKPTKELLVSVQAGVRWLLTMQNPDGGWSAFEQGVDDDYVDIIPFNDMDNWRDPSTADVTARCLQMLGELGMDSKYPPARKALRFIEKEQEKDGSWFGRWGVNYIYGTWSVIMALTLFLEKDHSVIVKGCDWLENIQNEDGGWGETCDSYDEERYIPLGYSTASQTAWALLALIRSGRVESESVKRGIDWLVTHQNELGTWDEKAFTGTGFPKHFYLHYDYYRHYFPMWALGEYMQYL